MEMELDGLKRWNLTVQKGETGRPQRMIVNGRKEKLDGLNIKLLNKGESDLHIRIGVTSDKDSGNFQSW